MFIFDFAADTVLDQIIDWLYGKIIGFLNDFFAMMNNMGVELFELPWVNAITTFFGWLGWALFVVGLVVGAFEMFGYSTDLRSKTQGRGNYSMFFEKYEPVPKNVQEKVLAAKTK